MKENIINLKFILISVFAVAVFFSTKAQEAVLTAGGDIASPHGNVSYSIGQVIQTMDTATTGSVAHGVQQPYEISEITGIQQIIKHSVTLSVFPNPTNNYLMLKLDSIAYTGKNIYRYQLFDVYGKVLEKNDLSEDVTVIPMQQYVPGNYFLVVLSGNRIAKTFKIIKY